MATAKANRPRNRRAQSKAASRKGKFVCPDCGRRFERAQSLGAHRRQAHGIAGTSKRTLSRARAAGQPPATRSPAASSGAQSQRARARSAAVSGSRPAAGADRSVDRDDLLRTLFPDGIPPRGALIEAVNNWLDEAERLARQG